MATVTTTTGSGFLNLNLKDVGKAALMLLITTFVSNIVQSIQSGSLPTLAQLKTALIIGATAAVSYLLKNLFTPATPVTVDVPATPTVTTVNP